MIIDELMCQISSGTYDERIMDIYVDNNKLSYQKQRYVSTLRDYMEEFGSDDVEIYSAPGRSEIGGNHTDHQNGEILVASINLDAIGIVKKTTDNKVTILSKGYTLITISLDNLEMHVKLSEWIKLKPLVRVQSKIRVKKTHSVS